MRVVCFSELQKLTCAGPDNLAGQQLSDLTEQDLCPEGESDLEQGIAKPPLETSSGTRNIGSEKSGGNVGTLNESAGGLQEDALTEVKSSGVRLEVIIAAVVIGVLVLAFIAFVIVYKCRLSKKKSSEERTSRTHQNKRYVYVITLHSLFARIYLIHLIFFCL